MMTTDMILFLANAVVALLIAYVCLCRLNVLTRNSLRRVRFKYSLIMTTALTVGGLPIFFGLRHNMLTLSGVLLVLVLLMLEVRHWRHGPPICTYKQCQK